MEKKKPTRVQLEKAIEKAIVYIPKKDATTIRFDDIGITIHVTPDFAVISENFVKVIYTKIVSNGISTPYIYMDILTEITNRYKKNIEVVVDGANTTSFAKLKKYLTDAVEKIKDEDDLKEKSNELTIVNLCEIFFYTTLSNKFDIGNEPLDVTTMLINYSAFLAKYETIKDIDENGVTIADLTNRYITYFRLFNTAVLNGDIAVEDVEKVENEALEKLKAIAEEKGAKISDELIVPKLDFEQNESEQF